MSDDNTTIAPPAIPQSTAALRGVLHTNPVFGTTDNGPYAQLNVATTDRFDGRNGPEERTQIHRVVAYGDVATSLKAATLGVGAGIELTGTPRINSWEKDGVRHRTVEIAASAVTPHPGSAQHQNSVTMAGTLREPTVSTKQGNRTLAKLSLAVPTFRADGTATGREDWHTITCWGKTAEIARRPPVGAALEIKANLAHRALDVERDTGGKAKRYLSELTGFSIRDLAKEQKREAPQTTRGQSLGL